MRDIILPMRRASLPKFLHHYFWDIDAFKLNPSKRPDYIIQRLLEMGDIKAIRWVRRNFSKRQIEENLCQSRQLTQKTANFWSLLLGVKKKEVRCLQKDFQRTPRAIWPY